MSSVVEAGWLNYVVTPDERHAVVASLTRLHRALSRSGHPDPLPAPSPPSSLSDASDGDLAAVSRRALRLFASIYALTNAYENLVLGLLLRRKPFPAFLRDLRSLSALRLAAFVAAYSSVYRIVLRQLRTRVPAFSPAPNENATPPTCSPSYRPSLSNLGARLSSSPYLAPFLAGVFAAPTMLIEGSGQRRVTIALYVLTRSVQGVWDGVAKAGVVPRAMREGRWWWGGHLLFAASNAVLLHAFVFHPSSFPQAYSSFILKRSKNYLPPRPASYPLSTPWPSSRDVVDGITSAALAHYPRYITPVLHPDLSQLTDPARTLPLLAPILAETHPGHESLTCAFLHPAEVSCWVVAETFVRDEFRSAAKFFGALAVLGAGVRWKKLVNDPESGIYKAVLSTLTSSAFLSLSLGTAWSTICLFQQYLPSAFLPTKRFYIQGFLAGLWVALVDVGLNGAGRATDLGMYTARLAIQCAWDVWVKQGRVKNVRNGDVIYFAVGMGTLLSIYEVNPKAIRSNFVRAALKQLGGESTAERDDSSTRRRRMSVVKDRNMIR